MINIVRDHQKTHGKILKEKNGLTTYVTMTSGSQTKHLELCLVCQKNQFLDKCESITKSNRIVAIKISPQILTRLSDFFIYLRNIPVPW